MNPEGHAGLSLVILSILITMLDWTTTGAIVFCLALVVFSTLHDLDLRLWPFVEHRSPLTHSLFAGVIFGAGLAILASYAGFNPWLGFVCGFGGTVLHLLGDIFTFVEIRPLWPVSRRGVALGLFRSSNQLVNKSLIVLGTLMFLTLVLRGSGFVG
jgi:inner membrane protein